MTQTVPRKYIYFYRVVDGVIDVVGVYCGVVDADAAYDGVCVCGC